MGEGRVLEVQRKHHLHGSQVEVNGETQNLVTV